VQFNSYNIKGWIRGKLSVEIVGDDENYKILVKFSRGVSLA